MYKHERSQPEERVRQCLLKAMVEELGYPKEQISIEKSLSQMPHLHLSNVKLPNRRADIVCFSKNIHQDYPLWPLLVIECKAHQFSEEVKQQVKGYNYFLKAFFIAIANEREIETGWYDSSLQDYHFIKGLPTYDSLVQAIVPIP
ncbi:MAG: type I restriction enzyme HsdR N-terminal domain-containing protein [Chlamydiales bacterium]